MIKSIKSIGTTGSRSGMSNNQKTSLVSILNQLISFNNKIIEIHHGDCVGSDSQFHNICVDIIPNISIIIHQPEKDILRANMHLLKPRNGEIVSLKNKLSYLNRNKKIVDNSDILIAFPSSINEVMYSGTWSTIRYAKKMNKKIIIIFPDGTTESFNY